MAGTDRAFSLPAATCRGCGFYLPPATSWTTLTVAEHAYRHAIAERLARDERGEVTMRSDVEAELAVAVTYVDALRDARRADLARHIDLEERYLDLSARRYDLAERVNVLEALATWEVTL